MDFAQLFPAKKPLILASKSAQRTQILTLLKVNHQVRPSSFEEIIPPELAASPEKIAKYFAESKALNLQKEFPDDLILGVDTLVVNQHGQVLGKPKTRSEAKQMLLDKSQAVERVISGISLISPKQKLTLSATSLVYFKEISPEEAEVILNWDEWQGRSGGFSVEGRSSLLVKRIEGDFYNIVGLPVFTFGQMLLEIKDFRQ
jgi:septum formation protein